jgi:DNA-binding CsgD family transcriptional regulator
LSAGDDLRWMSRLLWWLGRGEEASRAGDDAIALLEAFPESRELAMALSARSQLAMLHERREEAIRLGLRAAALARSVGDTETLAHALTNVGSAMIGGPETERGRSLLLQAHELAGRADDHAARALVNLATGTLTRCRSDPRAGDDVERALAFAQARELDGYVQYMLGVRACLRLLLGSWVEAEADARASLALGSQPGVSLCPALVVIGTLQARRGDADASTTLDQARRLAERTGELQRLAPVAAALAEHAWLADDLAAVVAAAGPVYELACSHGDAWARAELAAWLRRAGEDVPRHAAGAIDAFPYERALALCDGGDDAARLEALASFDALGATRTAAHLRRRLRADGVRRIPRAPRAVSRGSFAGLTPRESEVMALLRHGATNADIAKALVISPKTVDHHVSRVLAKLGVKSRREVRGAVGERWGGSPDVRSPGGP